MQQFTALYITAPDIATTLNADLKTRQRRIPELVSEYSFMMVFEYAVGSRYLDSNLKILKRLNREIDYSDLGEMFMAANVLCKILRLWPPTGAEIKQLMLAVAESIDSAERLIALLPYSKFATDINFDELIVSMLSKHETDEVEMFVDAAKYTITRATLELYRADYDDVDMITFLESKI